MNDFYIEEHLSDGKTRVTAAHRHYKHPETGLWHRNVSSISDVYPKPGLMPWAVANFNTPAEQKVHLDAAGAIGTLTHDDLDFGGILKYDPSKREHWPYLAAAHNFFETFQPRVLRREFTVYGECEGIRIAGTVDVELILDAGLVLKHLANRRKKINQDWRDGDDLYCIIDYKTSNNLYRGHEIQAAGYWYCLDSRADTRTPLLLQLGTKSKAGWYLKEVDLISTMPVFEACCRIHKDLYPDDDPASWLVESEYDFTKWLPEKEL